MLKLRPTSLKEANALVGELHRHHKAAVGHRFSIGAERDGELIGAVIVGRPVARGSDNGHTAEVTRLVTDGTKNACSILYAAAARAAEAMGYSRIQTYILEGERGTSLKATGWEFETMTAGGLWKYTGQERKNEHPCCRKQRWAKQLRPARKQERREAAHA